MGTYCLNGNVVSGDALFSVKGGTTIITLTWSSVRGAGIKDCSDSVVYEDPSFLWELPASDCGSIMCDDLGVLWEGVIKDCNDGFVFRDLAVLWEVPASKTVMISLYMWQPWCSLKRGTILITLFLNNDHEYEHLRKAVSRWLYSSVCWPWTSERWCHEKGGTESSALSCKPRFPPSFLRYDHHVVAESTMIQVWFQQSDSCNWPHLMEADISRHPAKNVSCNLAFSERTMFNRRFERK